jgi:hypothetical protein
MLVPLPLHPGVVGPFPGTGCLVPQPFAAGGNRLYLEFWAITGGPRYSGYITPTVAPEPSIERVARDSHSMMGRTGTHMGLWAISLDRYSTDDIMKSHGSVRVVRMWCKICTDPVLRCFINPEGLRYGDLLVSVVPELTSWLTV